MGTDIYGLVEVKKDGEWMQIADLCKLRRNLILWPLLTRDWTEGKGLPEDFKKRLPIRTSYFSGGDFRCQTWLSPKELEEILNGPTAKKILAQVSPDWIALFEKIKKEAEKYGDNNVRIIMWFNA
ncbi:hypothetical protein HYV83_02400 [Candidatus Woesearchaeota archaeon]|nr:hypothetical protein [Candidatus Woesearchaeota archaeon]